MTGRIVCPCGVEMRCLKNSINVMYKAGTTYSADLFGCPECDNKVAITASQALPYDTMMPPCVGQDILMRGDQ